jgi:uncharacterized protein involved in exopolysaccharide biosynthesis
MDHQAFTKTPKIKKQYELGLADLLAFAWNGRWVVLLGALLGIGLGVLFLSVATYRYKATLFVTPVKSEMTQLPGGISGLAAVAGINLSGGGDSNDFNLYIMGLKSRQVAAELAKDNAIMHTLFANEYNTASGQWRRPSGFVVALLSAGKSALGVPGVEWRPPDPADLQKFIETNVKVATDRKSNITNISLDHKNPQFAVNLITKLHEQTDAFLRRQALSRADQSIGYLEKQLSRVQLAEHREALAAILGEQEKARMLASSAAPFSAQPFGNAVASSRPTSPQPFIVLIAGLVGGAILGLGAILALQIRSISSARD